MSRPPSRIKTYSGYVLMSQGFKRGSKLMHICFLIVAVSLTSDSTFLVLYIMVFKYSIFDLPQDLELNYLWLKYFLFAWSNQKWHSVEQVVAY